MERRYRRTKHPVDEGAYVAAAKAARISVAKSPADNLQRSFEEVAGDQYATWRKAQQVLHSKPTVYRSVEEYSTLVTEFSKFFVDKLPHIRNSMSTLLCSFPASYFQPRSYTGPFLTDFTPVTVEEVQRIVLSMPAKCSPLDIILTLLLKSCITSLTPVLSRLENLSFSEGCFPTNYKTVQVLPLIKKPGLEQSSPSNYRPNSNLTATSNVIEKLSRYTIVTTPTLPSGI